MLFIIHTKDHDPAHVHVYFGTPKDHEARARVQLQNVEIIDSDAFTGSDLKKIEDRCEKRKEEFLTEWRRINRKKLQ